MPSVHDLDIHQVRSTRTIEELQNLTDLNEITSCLEELDTEEAQIDADLDDILSRRDETEAKLNRLSKMRPRIETLQTGANDLSNLIEETSSVAERISAKVRQLDLEQSRVKLAIKTVEDVQELKVSILGLHQAMNSKNWEAAARYLHRARQINPEVINGKFAEEAVPTSEIPEPPPKTLQMAQDTLHEIFTRDFEKATHSRSEADISFYFKLFPLIGKEEEGLDSYARFICGIIAGRCYAFMMQKPSTPTFFASALTALFENIAKIVDQHQPIVDSHYGKGKFHRVIERLQVECDKQGKRILESWWDERSIERKINEVLSYTFPYLNALKSDSGLTVKRSLTGSKRGLIDTSTQISASFQGDDDDEIDAREIDSIINELSLMSTRWNMYIKFLRSEENADIVTGLLEKSILKEKLEERMKGVYTVMETWFLRKSIERSHMIDEPDLSASPPVTSCVDDVFYILKKILYRNINTTSVETVVTMSKNVLEILENDYLSILVKRLENVYQVAPTSGTGRASFEADRKRREKEQNQLYVMLLNNLDLSSEYIQRVIDEILHNGQLENYFTGENEFKNIQGALKGVGNMANKFSRSLTNGLEQLFTQLIKPRIRILLNECYSSTTGSNTIVPKDGAGTVRYNLNEDEYQEAELQDAIRRRFSKGWETLIVEPFKGNMTTNIFGHLMLLCVDALVRPWEKMIIGYKFSELGALRLDKDIRSVQIYLSSLTSFGVRDRFTRLNQMSTVLNLESGDDVDDLWNNSGISWRLTLNEVKKIAGLREV